MIVTEVIKSRRSIRKYLNTPIPDAVIREILECARMAPSGNNVQPWRFVVVTDPAIKSKIASAATWGKFINDAYACIAIFGSKESDLRVEDCSLAVENIMLSAWHFSLGTCWVNSHHESHTKLVEALLKCPGSYELMSLIALGYPDERPQVEKKSLDEVMSWNSF